MTVAVVVATYNRPAQLRRLLECLAAQTAKAEVIVVDDGSDVPLDELVRPFHCTLIRQANAGPASARNRGVAAAKSDFIAFTDDDCEPEPTWLENLLGRLQAHPACLAGGRTVNAAAGNAYQPVAKVPISRNTGSSGQPQGLIARKALFRAKRFLQAEVKPFVRETCRQSFAPSADLADNKVLPPLEPPGRADLKQAPQYQTQIERTGVNQNPLPDVIPPS